MKERYIVSGMSCTACSTSVERVVRKLKGINVANVNLIAKTLYVEYDENQITKEDIINQVKKAGFTATLDVEKKKKVNYVDKPIITSDSLKPSIKTRIIVSFSLLLPLMYIQMGEMIGLPLPSFILKTINPTLNAIIQACLALPVLIINIKFFINGFRGLIHLSPNMDTLVMLGSLVSYIYGIVEIILIANGNISYVNSLYFDSSAMILALITIGKALEEKAKSKTMDSIESLKKLAPTQITILKGDQEYLIDIDDVEVNDKVIVKTGESIPVDGIIINGQAMIDTSALTGESIPVYKTVGDEVLSATINMDGALIVEAKKVKGDTTLSRIIELVKDAGASKAPIQRLADKISAVFVPAVMGISLITCVVWLIINGNIENAIFHAVQVLVISCPCALGLATPVAVTASIGASAKSGILIKKAEVFELLSNIDSIIFDKTGTLTEGRPSVDKIYLFNNYKMEDFLIIAKTMESMSTHPIAKAIYDYIDFPVKKIEDYKNIPGKGITGLIDSKIAICGSELFLNEKGIDTSIKHTIEDELDSTLTFFSYDNKLIGIITIKDKIKESSKETIRLLKEKNIYLSLLSGDNFNVCNRVKEELGIDVAYDSVLPDDKERIVREVKESGRNVAFVGDGINDSPALLQANVGISLESGTDIAIDSASIILLKNNLKDINKVIDISKRTVIIIKENLFWAFIYNIICIPIAAGALSFLGINLNPMIASLCMSISSLFVVTNALRLRKVKEKK